MCKFCIGRGRPVNETIVSTESCWWILLPFCFSFRVFFYRRKCWKNCLSYPWKKNKRTCQTIGDTVFTQTCQKNECSLVLDLSRHVVRQKAYNFWHTSNFSLFWTNKPNLLRLKWCWRVTDTLKGQCQGDFAFFTCKIVLNIWLSIILFILFWFCTVERSKT